MARYIERELLLNALKEERENGNFVFTSKWIKEIMDKIPSADVAPKSEVDWHREAELNAQRIIELEAEKDALIKNYAECMKDYAREIFEEIEEMLIDSTHIPDCARFVDIDKLAELKKKYTGVEDGDE